MWNISGRDWNAPPAAEIEKEVARQVRGGDVILLHDGGHRGLDADRAQTVTATDNLMRRCADQGYKFVTVEKMLAGS
jgi:peptidoglycan/xylan/chitin deacetylase (PgdA/CDA1 family)